MVITMINQITSNVQKNHNSLVQERADVATSAARVAPSSSTPSQSPESNFRMVNEKVINAIDKELAKNNVGSVRESSPQNFTPESVAKGILNFVQGAISRARARGNSTDDVLNQARKGIDKGFSEAKDILTSLNALKGQIAKGVENTYNLIQHGLNRLDQGMDLEESAPAVSHINAESISHTQSFELTLNTSDGDEVKIGISRDASQNHYAASLVQAGTEINVTQSESSQSNGISLSVSGQLDADEVKAIEDLLVGVKSVSDKFFSDDVNAAFEAGLSLGYNTQEIAGFALDLNESKTQSASRVYREIGDFGNNNHRVSPVQLENLLKPAHDFTSQFKNELIASETRGREVEFKDLFNYLSSSNPNNRQAIDNFSALGAGSLENVTQQLISAIKN